MDLFISYDNLVARIEPFPLPQDVVLALCGELRYRPDGYQHVYKFKAKQWDGYNYLFDIKNQCFRRGLLDRTVSLLTSLGHKVHTKYIGVSPIEVEHRLVTKDIRPFAFQQGIVEPTHANSMGIIVSPTGTGKTVMISLLLQELKRVSMVLVTDVVLLDQMQQALQRYFDQPIGMIGDGEFDLQDITVSTIQSLHSIKKAKSIAAADKRIELMKFLNRIGAVISDEGHLYDSDQVGEIMTLFGNADKFFGMSATPYGWAEKTEKRENLELEQHFGRVIYDTRKNNFVDLGLKVPIYVQVVNRTPVHATYDRKMKKNRFKGGMLEPDFTANYRECLEVEILKNEQYHAEIAKCVIDLNSSGHSAFVHAAHSIAFGESIHKLIPGSVLVNGKTPRLVRRGIYDAIRKKEILALVSDVGGTGLDIPSLNAIVLASDLQDIRQLKGRVERSDKSPGATKDHGLLVDFHTRTSFLTKHFNTRKSQYEHDKHLIIG